jgi:hypothetical protein
MINCSFESGGLHFQGSIFFLWWKTLLQTGTFYWDRTGPTLLPFSACFSNHLTACLIFLTLHTSNLKMAAASSSVTLVSKHKIIYDTPDTTNFTHEDGCLPCCGSSGHFPCCSTHIRADEHLDGWLLWTISCLWFLSARGVPAHNP